MDMFAIAAVCNIYSILYSTSSRLSIFFLLRRERETRFSILFEKTKNNTVETPFCPHFCVMFHVSMLSTCPPEHYNQAPRCYILCLALFQNFKSSLHCDSDHSSSQLTVSFQKKNLNCVFSEVKERERERVKFHSFFLQYINTYI